MERLVVDLNGGVESGKLANIYNPTIKQIYINEAMNKKTGLVEFANETKTGGADFSAGQTRSMNGEAVQLVGDNIPNNLRGTWIQSKKTPYEVTRIIFQTGEIITTY